VRQLVYYVGMTIDGRIAAPDGSADLFPVTPDVIDLMVTEFPDALPSHAREHFGVEGANPNFDVALQGRRSYDVGLAEGVPSPYAHLRQLVVSRTLGESPDAAVEIIRDDVVDRVRALKAEEGGDIYLVGGARLAGTLLAEVDALVVKLYPVVAGDGIPLFDTTFSPTSFTLREHRALPGGMVLLRYDRA
jgi:dihydrofolate reductase